MAILLNLSDFIGGEYDLPDATGMYTDDNVQAAIDKYEKPAIYNLLGVALGDLIIAYIQSSSPPFNADYDKIINGFAEDNQYYTIYNTLCGDYNSVIINAGLKEWLKAVVFYEYVKISLVTSQPGVTQPEAETGQIQKVTSTMRFAENKFNQMLDTAYAIQWYCVNNKTNLPDYNGQRITVKASNIF